MLIGRRRVAASTAESFTSNLPGDLGLLPSAEPRSADVGAESRSAEAGAESRSAEAGAEGHRRRLATTRLRRRQPPAPAAEPIITVESPPLLTGERTPARMRRFVLVQAFTVGSLLLGMGAIFLALHGDVKLAAVSLACCVIFDGIDGALARAFKVSTPFGGQMDSLADMCSFGIATPVVAFAWLASSLPGVVVAPVCALVAVCAAIRLARFNVSPKNGYYFCGVPTTMAAAIIVASVLILPDAGAGMLLVGVGSLALLMVSTFPYMKIGQARRIPPLLWAVILVAAWADLPTAFSLVIAGYLASGPLLWAKQRLAVTA